MTKDLSCFNDIYDAIDSLDTITGEDMSYLLSRFCDDQDRWETFLDIIRNNPKITKEAFSVGLKDAYDSGHADFNAMGLFEELQSEEYSDVQFSPEEKEAYDLLPDTITIYRGTCKDECDNEDYGISWTTDRGTAEFFAFRERHHRKEDGIVLKLTIPKDTICAYLIERDEYEAIYIVENWSVVPEVLTDVPTEFFDRYILENKIL